MDIDVETTKADYEKLYVSSHEPRVFTSINGLKRNAYVNLQNNDEPQAIVNLVESHSQTLRAWADYRYATKEKAETLNKEWFSFQCRSKSFLDVKQCVQSMPKEWTLVQLTLEYNQEESTKTDIIPDKWYTGPMHLTVFDCGKDSFEPFIITTKDPKMELVQNMFKFIENNNNQLNPKNINVKSRKKYFDDKLALIYLLKDIVKQIEYSWLKEWRCLFTGKLKNQELDCEINEKIENCVTECSITEKQKYILRKLAKEVQELNTEEIKCIVKYLFKDDENLKKRVNKTLLQIKNDYAERKFARNPVILIIDGVLDMFPWEMMKIMRKQPVSRIPALYFAYALFKEHELSIQSGMRIIKNRNNGKYIINAGLDLDAMEKRIMSFLKYWLPQWTGINGKKPTSQEFLDVLKNSDIFLYSGHGSGMQFVGCSNIEKLRIEAIAILFGCSSISFNNSTAIVQSYSSYHEYLIACSPCVVGMLWNVTDTETDLLSAQFLSKWIKSNNPENNWDNVDHAKWAKQNEIVINPNLINVVKEDSERSEPELLNALNICKMIENPSNYLVRAAAVARGIPVCIKYE